ncbi:MAG: Rieske 2Fe-2S domain-containing protein [Hyphomicrobiaceae bacterium]
MIGRMYWVPALFFTRTLLLKKLWWPVTGALHTDPEFFHFHAPHCHLDTRFLNQRHAPHLPRQMRLCDNYLGNALACPATADSVFAYVPGPHPAPEKPTPKLMRCKRLEPAYPFGQTKQVVALNAAFATNRVRHDAEGRPVCPHRGYRLDQLAPGGDGIVTCPLHGLRIRLSDGACGV